MNESSKWRSTKHYCPSCRVYIDGRPLAISHHESSGRHKASMRSSGISGPHSTSHSVSVPDSLVQRELYRVSVAARDAVARDVREGTAGIRELEERGMGKGKGTDRERGMGQKVDFVEYYNRKHGHLGNGVENGITDEAVTLFARTLDGLPTNEGNSVETHEDIVEAALSIVHTREIDENTGLGKWETISKPVEFVPNVVSKSLTQKAANGFLPSKVKSKFVARTNEDVSDEEKEEREYNQKYGRSSLIKAPESKKIFQIDEVELNSHEPVIFKKRKGNSNIKKSAVGVE